MKHLLTTISLIVGVYMVAYVVQAEETNYFIAFIAGILIAFSTGD